MAQQSVQELVTHDPVTVDASASLVDAARLMREHGTGAIIATDAGKVRGIVTDRDIVVRAVAEVGDPSAMRIEEICSTGLVTLNPRIASRPRWRRCAATTCAACRSSRGSARYARALLVAFGLEADRGLAVHRHGALVGRRHLGAR